MFNESNSVELYICDLLCGKSALAAREAQAAYTRDLTRIAYGLGWVYQPAGSLRRAVSDVLLEGELREALARLNPEIAERPDRADEVLYKLRAILLAVNSEGLVRANEEFSAWLRGERSMPFGPNNQHTTVRLIDFDVDPFDVTRPSPVDIDKPLQERQIGGLGLHLVRQMASTLRYEFADRRSTITFTMALR